MNLIVVQLAEVRDLEGDSPVAVDSAHSDSGSGGPAGCRYVDLDVADTRVQHIWEVLSPEAGAELKVAVANGNAGLARVQWQYAWDNRATSSGPRNEGDLQTDTNGRVESMQQAWREYLREYLPKPIKTSGGNSSAPGVFLVCHRFGAASGTTSLAVQGDEDGLSRAHRAGTPVHPVGVFASRIKKKEPCTAKKQAATGAESNTGSSTDFSDWKMHVASRRAGDPSFGARVPCSPTEVSSSGQGFVTEVVPIQSLRLWLRFAPVATEVDGTSVLCEGVDDGAAVLPSRSWERQKQGVRTHTHTHTHTHTNNR